MTKELGQVPSGTMDLPQALLGTMLSPQAFFTPIRRWVDGVYRAEKKPGPSVQFTHPQAAGMFQWTKNAEDDLKSRQPLSVAALPDTEKLGIVYFVELHSGRFPWNTGLR